MTPGMRVGFVLDSRSVPSGAWLPLLSPVTCLLTAVAALPSLLLSGAVGIAGLGDRTHPVTCRNWCQAPDSPSPVSAACV